MEWTPFRAALVAFVSVAAAAYLGAAFICLSFNAADWLGEARGLVVSMTFIIGVPAAGLSALGVAMRDSSW